MAENTKLLYTVALMIVIVGLVVGVGVLVLDKFSLASRTQITTVQQITIDNNTYTTLSNVPVSKINSVINASDSSDTVPYEVAGNAIRTTSSGYNGTLANVSYIYGEANAGSTATTAGADAVGDIANDWLSLIVVIGILAVILGLVIGAFAMKGR